MMVGFFFCELLLSICLPVCHALPCNRAKLKIVRLARKTVDARTRWTSRNHNLNIESSANAAVSDMDCSHEIPPWKREQAFKRPEKVDLLGIDPADNPHQSSVVSVSTVINSFQVRYFP
eukprot:TRINITY_DN2105_c0_g1::TRINITY_DN2105_c0_g1_i1::g.12736::m.12736 TRINITY_DN2105_c0_g1::TRINITY_DN2105_c0_g1_i1::g.12736  ORF type:complete len:119 (+),score=-20.46,ASD1/PF08688.5/0.12 TRINITY_DN2105_c0_g1_i1:221-577(+)